MSRSSISLLGRAGIVVVLTTLLASCGDGQKQQQAGPPPTPVTVAPPVKRTVTDYDEYVGRFNAVNSVEVRARVSGYLDAVHFKDGQLVKDGDLLFTIDKRPFQNAVAQARATLAAAQSNLAFTEADYTRGQQLVKEKTITDQTFEQRSQAYRNARAAVSGAEAQVRTAELDLEFTELRAPIAGRIGDRRVTPGNLVTGGTSGNTTLLATIVSTDPIYFEFTFDEASYLRYERNAGKGDDIASRGASVQVGLKLIDESDFVHNGRMDFVDNVIDRTSGTIRGRAVFANANGVFTPGMFGRVRVPATSPYQALLVPDTAIGSEQVRKYVLVVDAQNKTVQKYVTLGQLVDGKLRVIKEGLSPDDKVIVNGIARVRPGQPVNPQPEGQGQSGAQPGGQPAAAPAPAK
ncbi:MAG: efflux RND transporter periplasmic adaptor subunit [Proteobacteria bacterium]|nr:efflux RND transporter periplasmic adaptor subunit [Pseudomonadota bacterium]